MVLSPAIVPAMSASPARSMPSASAAAAPGGVRTIRPVSARTNDNANSSSRRRSIASGCGAEPSPGTT